MKKTSFVLTVFVLAAMLLAACAGGGGNGNTAGTPGVDMAPTLPGDAGTGGDTLGTPTTGADSGLGTPAGDDMGTAVGTPTVEATDGADAMGTPTTSASGSDDSTGGQAGMSAGQYALLSELIAMSVSGQDGEQLGTVQGVVIDNGIPVTGSDSGTSTGSGTGTGTGTGTGAGSATTKTPAAGGSGTETTSTPEASGSGDSGSTGSATTQTPATGDTGSSSGTGTGSGTDTSGSVSMGNSPKITYVLVNVDGQSGTSGTGTTTSGSDTSSGSDASATGTGTKTPVAGGSGDAGGSGTPEAGSDAMDTTPTAAAGSSGADSSGMTAGGDAVAVPWDAFAMEDTNTQAMGTLTLNADVDSAALAGAPTFSDDMAQGMGDQTASINEYWSGQGLSIPATGDTDAQQAGQQVVIRDSLSTMSVNDQAGTAVGQIIDFVVDLSTGELAYAVLSGQSGDSQFYAVPMDNLTWEAGEGAATGMGTFSAGFDGTVLEGAPSVSSVDEFDWSDTSEFDTYWQSQGGMTK